MKMNFVTLILATVALATSCKKNTPTKGGEILDPVPRTQSNEPQKAYVEPMPAPQELSADIDAAAKWSNCLTSAQKANDIFGRDSFNRTWSLMTALWDASLAKEPDPNTAYLAWQGIAMEAIQTARNEAAQIDGLGEDNLKTADHSDIRRCRGLGITFAVEKFNQLLHARLPGHCDTAIMKRDGALAANYVCAKLMIIENVEPLIPAPTEPSKCEPASVEACKSNFDTKLKSFSELCPTANEKTAEAFRTAARDTLCR